MSPWVEDHADELKKRPYLGRPTWELQNMKKALSLLPWMNSPDQLQRLLDVTIELTYRTKGA